MVFLTPEEDSYVRFLELRRVPMKEEGEDTEGDGEDARKALDVLRKLSETDRVAMEYGTRAFVSYLRAYKEHVCKYIFQFSELEMGWLASSFGALRLPKMKEIKKAARLLREGKLEGFVESSVEIDSIPFKDSKREKQRLEGQEKKKQERVEQTAAARGGQHFDESHGRGDRNGKDIQKDGKDARNPKQSNDKNRSSQQIVRLTASKRRTLESRQELADLEDDYALWKKLKKGKITQAEYDAAMELDDNDDGLVEAALQKKKKRGRRGKQVAPQVLNV
jgi:ATP-dependent RNA helicase DDX55/SPB4